MSLARFAARINQYPGSSKRSSVVLARHGKEARILDEVMDLEMDRFKLVVRFFSSEATWVGATDGITVDNKPKSYS